MRTKFRTRWALWLEYPQSSNHDRVIAITVVPWTFFLFHSTRNDKSLTLRTSNLPFRWSSEMNSANAVWLSFGEIHSLPLFSLFEAKKLQLLVNIHSAGNTIQVLNPAQMLLQTVSKPIVHCGGLNHHLLCCFILPSLLHVSGMQSRRASRSDSQEQRACPQNVCDLGKLVACEPGGMAEYINQVVIWPPTTSVSSHRF